jgi:hypothetical protein
MPRTSSFWSSTCGSAVPKRCSPCAEIFPEEDVPARARLVLEEIFDGQ